jgi:hypothetical protein
VTFNIECIPDEPRGVFRAYAAIDGEAGERSVVLAEEHALLRIEQNAADHSARRWRRAFLVLLAVAALMGLALVEKAARAEGTGQRIEALR